MGTEIGVLHAYRDGYEKSNRSECKDVKMSTRQYSGQIKTR